MIVVHQGGVRATPTSLTSAPTGAPCTNPSAGRNRLPGQPPQNQQTRLRCRLPHPRDLQLNIICFHPRRRSVSPSVTTGCLHPELVRPGQAGRHGPSSSSPPVAGRPRPTPGLHPHHPPGRRSGRRPTPSATTTTPPKSRPRVGSSVPCGTGGDLFVDITRTALSGRFKNSPYDGNFAAGSDPQPPLKLPLPVQAPVSTKPPQQAIQAAAARFERPHPPSRRAPPRQDGTLRVPAGQNHPAKPRSTPCSTSYPALSGTPRLTKQGSSLLRTSLDLGGGDLDGAGTRHRDEPRPVAAGARRLAPGSL